MKRLSSGWVMIILIIAWGIALTVYFAQFLN